MDKRERTQIKKDKTEQNKKKLISGYNLNQQRTKDIRIIDNLNTTRQKQINTLCNQYTI